MANITFPRANFEKHVRLNDEIIEKINLLGTPVETFNDDFIEIQVLPNRPDLLSLQGFIRAFKAFLGKETGLRKYRIHKGERNYKVKIDPSVASIRPFTTCAIVKNLNFDDAKIKEVIDIQEKLHSTLGRNRKKVAIGIYPLEKIKLPITYTAKVPHDIKFVPLEMNLEMNGLQILQRHPAGREYAHLLEKYSKFPVFVDSNKKILSMPPIINSNDTGKITEKTTSVFIECSGFDLGVLNKTLNIVVTTLAEMGGKIYSIDLIYDKKITTPNLSSEKIKLNLDNTNKLLGLNLKEKDLEKLLPKMGYDYKKPFVFIPAWRTDILHEIDIIEDIAIAYGYNNFAHEIPRVATIAQETEESIIKTKISEILVGLNFLETSSFHLIKQNEIPSIKDKEKIEVENSKTEYKFLRPSLLIPALRTLAENKDSEYPQKIYEIGTVFEKFIKSETGIRESSNLIIACTPSNFTDLKRILDYLTKMLGLDYDLKESLHENLIEGRAGTIYINNKNLGYIGELHPELLRSWNIKMPVSVIELNFDEIISIINKN